METDPIRAPAPTRLRYFNFSSITVNFPAKTGIESKERFYYGFMVYYREIPVSFLPKFLS